MNLDVEVPNCVLGRGSSQPVYTCGKCMLDLYVDCVYSPQSINSTLGGIYIKNNYIMIIKNNELIKYTRERNLFALAVLWFVLLLTCTQVQC